MKDGPKTVLMIVAVALGAFLLGAGWQYLTASRLAGELEQARSEAAFNALEATLGAATIEAQRGAYELARQHASEFFSGLQTDIDRADAAHAGALRDILGQRDPMITALSRSNPQSASLLAQLFTRFRLAMGRPVGPETTEPGAPPPPVDSPADTAAPPPTTTTGAG